MKKVQAIKGNVRGHHVLLVEDEEFDRWLLVVNEKVIGYLKEDDLIPTIERATEKPRKVIR